MKSLLVIDHKSANQRVALPCHSYDDCTFAVTVTTPELGSDLTADLCLPYQWAPVKGQYPITYVITGQNSNPFEHRDMNIDTVGHIHVEPGLTMMCCRLSIFNVTCTWIPVHDKDQAGPHICKVTGRYTFTRVVITVIQ